MNTHGTKAAGAPGRTDFGGQSPVSGSSARPERTSGSRGPSFFWQGLLILLPVAVMAIIGFTAIVRDKAAVEQEARQRAEEILPPLLAEASGSLTARLADFDAAARLWFEHERELRHRHVLETRSAPGGAAKPEPPAAEPLENKLRVWQAANPELRPAEVFPNRLLLPVGELPTLLPDPDEPPRPPQWLIELSPDQRRAWEALSQAQLAGAEPAAWTAAVNTFRETRPSGDARANLDFLELARTRGPGLLHFAQTHRQVPTESGLPLSTLALAAVLFTAEFNADPERVLDLLAEESATAPNVLLPELIAQAGPLIAAQPQRAVLEVLWSAQLRLAAIARATHLAGGLRDGTNLWVETAGRRWFCVLNTGSPLSTAGPEAGDATNRFLEVRAYPKAIVQTALDQALRQNRPALPTYAGWSATLGGELLTPASAPTARPSAALPLAAAQAEVALPGRPAVGLQLFLGDPARLFARQRQRTLLFGGVIAASALAALAGLLAARKAFRRQLRLQELKTNFVASVSHELRSPIASLRLLAESLERGRITEPPKQQEYFRFIRQECGRLSALIENVLDFSRMEQGRKQYDLEPTDLVALTRQTVQFMETYATERQVKLALTLPDPDVAILQSPTCVDGKAIQQALVNLIDNASKHSPKGETVTVGLEAVNERSRPQPAGANRRSEPPATRLWLWVEDRGEGIPPEEHERIFERFYRRGSELRRQTQGVGIGLSIVKHIVEGHGGRVLVRSAPGQGSRFTIELPVGDRPSEAHQRPTE